jgi:hypothetical protein
MLGQPTAVPGNGDGFFHLHIFAAPLQNIATVHN